LAVPGYIRYHRIIDPAPPTAIFANCSARNNSAVSPPDGGWSSSLGDSEKDRREGFVILGFEQSDLGQNGKSDGIAYGEFDEALRSKKYVGALAIRSAPTREDLEKTERVAANR
jgi:hypothetical protein